MKKAILILFLAMSLSFNSATKKPKLNYEKVSDRLDIYRLRDNHNVLEFDKKINIILVESITTN